MWTGGCLIVALIGVAAGAQDPHQLPSGITGPNYEYSYPAAAHPVRRFAVPPKQPLYAGPVGYGAPAGYGRPPPPKAPDCSVDCAEHDPWAQARCLRVCCGKSCGHGSKCRHACYARYHLSETEGPHEETSTDPTTTASPAPAPQPPHHPPPQPSYPTAKTLFKGYEYRSYRCAFTHNSNGALRCWTDNDGDFDCQVASTATEKDPVTSCHRGESKLTCSEEHGVYWCSEFAEAGFYYALPGAGPRRPFVAPRFIGRNPTGYPSRPSIPSSAYPPRPSYPSRRAYYPAPRPTNKYPIRRAISPYYLPPRSGYPAH